MSQYDTDSDFMINVGHGDQYLTRVHSPYVLQVPGDLKTPRYVTILNIPVILPSISLAQSAVILTANAGVVSSNPSPATQR